MASKVSVSEPIWLTLMRIALAAPSSMPFLRRFVFVTKRSSPTSWHLPPIAFVRATQPSQSPSAMPSSMESIGYFATRPSRYFTCSAEVRLAPFLPSFQV